MLEKEILNKIPQSFQQITIQKYNDLLELFKTKDLTFEDNLKLISFCLDLEVEEVENLDYDDYEYIVNKLNFLFQPPTPILKQSLIIEKTNFYLINYKNLTLGEFIDLEYYLTTPQENLTKILAVLYRQKIKSDDLLMPDKFEKYGNYVEHRSNFFEGINIQNGAGALEYYITYRKKLLENYELLFDKVREEELKEDDLNKLDRQTRIEVVKAEKEEKKRQKWGWLQMLYTLSNKNILEMERVTKLPLIHCLNVLSMKLETNQ
jgi:hypothetical protein